MLNTLVILLAAAVLLIPLSRRAGFGSVLGYLVAGSIIGPAGLALVTDVAEIREVSELGVIMLLFLIGLELKPQRLWVMRKSVFLLGPGQVVVTAAVLAGCALLAGVTPAGAAVLGAGLALSSTAIVLPMLAERDLLGSTAGRDTFAVLLFQDLAFIPLVAVVPLLAEGASSVQTSWLEVGRGIGAIALILVGGRLLLGRAFRAIGGARTPELFTALALLTVVGTAALAQGAGLSASLGAFLAGVLLSESEFRHELEADIAPFEGLLLGFFFISVGMSANLALALDHPGTIALALLVVLAGKIAVAFGLGRLRGQDLVSPVRFALALPQGSEFSFVLFGAAVGAGALSRTAADEATLVIALSMVATPILFSLSERLLVPRLGTAPRRPDDEVPNEDNPVIICGFGRMGQIVGRVLRMRGIPFTALEQDAEQVEVVRRFGTTVYYGDPSRPELLRAAGAETARLLVVTLGDVEQGLRLVDIARRTFPHLRIVARARNRRHAHLLMDRNVTAIVRETFHSGLRLSQIVLETVGVAPTEAERAIELFREHDERFLVTAHAYYEDERQLVQNSRQAADELASLFEADRTGRDAQAAKAGARAERA